MKRIYLFLIAAIISFSSFSQDSLLHRAPKNEIGVDVTKLLSGFFNFNKTDTANYFEPTLNVNFKRYFKHFIIRAGVGYNTYNYKEEVPYYFYISNSQIYNSSVNLKSYSNSLTLKLGIEKNYNISKKWQLLYGLDFIYYKRFTKDQDLITYELLPYIDCYLTFAQIEESKVGPSPFVGIKYNINDRFSIYTESFYWFYFLNSETDYSYLPLENNYLILQPTAQTHTIKGNRSYFTSPFSIHCAVKF